MPNKGSALLLKHDGRLLFASTYFCDLVGIKHDKVAGMSFFDFVFPEDNEAARHLFDITEIPHAEPVRFRLRHSDGTERWADIQAAPLNGTGRMYAITVTVNAANDKR